MARKTRANITADALAKFPNQQPAANARETWPSLRAYLDQLILDLPNVDDEFTSGNGTTISFEKKFSFVRQSDGTAVNAASYTIALGADAIGGNEVVIRHQAAAAPTFTGVTVEDSGGFYVPNQVNEIRLVLLERGNGSTIPTRISRSFSIGSQLPAPSVPASQYVLVWDAATGRWTPASGANNPTFGGVLAYRNVSGQWTIREGGKFATLFKPTTQSGDLSATLTADFNSAYLVVDIRDANVTLDVSSLLTIPGGLYDVLILNPNQNASRTATFTAGAGQFGYYGDDSPVGNLSGFASSFVVSQDRTTFSIVAHTFGGGNRLWVNKQGASVTPVDYSRLRKYRGAYADFTAVQAIANPATGDYATVGATGKMYVYNGSAWADVSAGAGGGGGGASENASLKALTYATPLVWDLEGASGSPRLRASVTTNGPMVIDASSFTQRPTTPTAAFDFFLVITIGNTNDAVTFFPGTNVFRTNENPLSTTLSANTKVWVVGYHDGASYWQYSYQVLTAQAAAPAPTGDAAISGAGNVGGTDTYSHTFLNSGGFTESGTTTWARYYDSQVLADADTTGTSGVEFLAPAVTLATQTRTFQNTLAMLGKWKKYFVRLRNNAGVTTLVQSDAEGPVGAVVSDVEYVSTTQSAAGTGSTSTAFTSISQSIQLTTAGAGSNLMAFFVVYHKTAPFNDTANADRGFNSATYNGIPLTLVDRMHNAAGNKAKVSVFQMLQANFPADGTYTFAATSPDDCSYAIVDLIIVRNALQATITKKAKAAANSSTTLTFSQLTAVTQGSLLMTFLGAGSGGGGFYTPNSGQNEIFDATLPIVGTTNCSRGLLVENVAADGNATDSVLVGANTGGVAGIIIEVRKA